MYLMYTSSDQCIVSGLLLAVGKNRMRVAVPGAPDAFELQLVDGCWSREDGETVTIESIIHSGEHDLQSLGLNMFPMVLRAS